MRKLIAIFMLGSILLLGAAWNCTAETYVGGRIDVDTIWQPENSPYIVISNILVASGITLTILPGVEILVNDGLQFYIIGTLQAGEVEFKAADDSNDWKGIAFDHSGPTLSSLQGCEITGTNGTGVKNAVIHVRDTSVEIRDCTITDSRADCGVYVQAGAPFISDCNITNIDGSGVIVANGANPTITENFFIRNTYGIRVYYSGASILAPEFYGNTYVDNAESDLFISGYIKGDVTWGEAAGTIYGTSGFSVEPGGRLTIEPGAIVAVDPGESITILGTLEASGATFKSAHAGQAWNGLALSGPDAGESIIENCSFVDVGVVSEYASHVLRVSACSPCLRGISFQDCFAEQGIYLQNGSPEISNTTFSGYSVAAIWASGSARPLVFNNSFSDNEIAVRLASQAGGLFRGNTFSGNRTSSVLNLTYNTVDGRYSDWGDPSGPYDPSDDRTSGGWYNPEGLGDAVSDKVNYDPWITSPASSDGDRIPDAWEVDRLGSTAIADDESDIDMDGLNDLYEFAYGADPQAKDTDNDGMPDGFEAGNHFNLTTDDGREDADLDLYSNLREFLSSSDPRDDTDIPAIIADGDGDGDVDGADLFGMLTAWLTPAPADEKYDIFPNDVIDDRDLFLFVEDFGRI